MNKISSNFRTRLWLCSFHPFEWNLVFSVPYRVISYILFQNWRKKTNYKSNEQKKEMSWKCLNEMEFHLQRVHNIQHISVIFFLLQRNEYDDNAFVCSQPLDKRNQAKYESNVWIISPQETQYYCVIECNVSSQFGFYCMMVFNLLMYTILIVDIGRSHFDNFPLFQQDNTNSLSLSSFVFVLFHHAVVVLVFFSVLRKLAYFRCRCVSSSFGRLINFEMSSEED